VLVEFLGSNLGKIAKELDKLIITLPQGQNEINREHIEKNIGISKDYNNFELQNALAKKDHLKAMRIVDYFSKNPKDNPIVVTITSLYFYFSKLLMYHFLPDKSKGAVASALKVNPYFVGEYSAAARMYKAGKVVQVISLLREYDLKSKGYKSNVSDSGELLRELVYKIIH
jgi:DNA polymerase III subunit delta